MELMKLVFFVVVQLTIFSQICMANNDKNVLFIMIDDWRPEMSYILGERSNMYDNINTTSIDALAARSLVLKRAYAQQAVCGPSRSSLLTGRRPDTTHTYDSDTNFRIAGGNFTTIPEYFKENGYISVGMGKIFHNGGSGLTDDPQSWSDEYTYFHPSNKYQEGTSISWKSVLNNDTKITSQGRQLQDVAVAEYAIATLSNFSAGGTYENRSFFMAVGFHKPHLPFYFMEDYEISETVGLASNPFVPEDFPTIAWNGYGELRKYGDITASGDFNTTLDETKAEELRKAYFATIEYIDDLVGSVIDELTNLGLENDTIIALMGDHGFHLGEHNMWAKKTNFEESLWTPFMLHIPGVTDGGINSSSLVEFVDIFPTLVEAANLTAIPTCPADSSENRTCTHGYSLIPLITNSSHVLREFAISQNTRRDTDVMGYTMRTENYRYTEWADFNQTGYHPIWSSVGNKRKELYDLTNDVRENVNVALTSNYTTIASDLSALLRAAVYDP